MGRIGTSWALVKQSFGILRSDKELMLLPILSAASCVLVTSVIAAVGGVAVYPQIKASTLAHTQWQLGQPLVYVGLFVFYVANYFVIVFFNTALVGAASMRLNGDNPTVKDGLNLAWERKGVILQWAVLSATVGVILKLIEERAQLIGRIVAKLVGLAWTLASYFVVPILAFEKLGPFDALKRSAQLFRKTWGEQVVGGFSFGLIFFLLALPGFVLPIMGGTMAGPAGLITGLAVMILYFVLLAVISSATHGIFVAALYRFANDGQVPPGFTAENFSMAWQPKR
jgi:hypothetical protein